jgi:hypothetical protein
LTLNSSGELEWTEGDEDSSPVEPTFPSGKLPICLIYCKVGMTKVVDYEDADGNPTEGYIYKDVRPLLGATVLNFLGLSDTPSTFTGQSLKAVRVNVGETALEFFSLLLSILGDVEISSPTNNQVLTYETASSKWKNKSVTDTDEKVKADSGDPTAGYLSAKVDDRTIKENGTTHQIYAYLPNYAAYTDDGLIIVAADHDSTLTVTTYTKIKEITLARAGTLKIYYEGKSTAPGAAYGKIRVYRNGVAVGSIHNLSTGSWEVWNDTIAGWSVGDKLQIYVMHADNLPVSCRNLRIKVNVIGTEVIDLD